MDRARTDFYTWTDLARLLAALLVAFSHARDVVMADYAGQHAFLPFYAVSGFGHSGVIVFFVLSGFWISRTVLRRMDGSSFWRDYAIDRLSRLWVVLLPALILGGALDWLGGTVLGLPVYLGTSGAHSVGGAVLPNLTLPIFAGNIAFLQSLVVPAFGSNGPLWSLAYEFWYYVWFPALALLVMKRKPTLALAGLAIVAVAPPVAWGFLSWLSGFALMLLLRPARPVPRRPWLVLAAALLLFGAAFVLSGAIDRWWFDPLLAASFALALYAIARVELPFPAFLRGAASYGAKASFSLYAIHFPVVALIGGWFAHDGRLAPSIPAVALVLGLTALCLAIGWLFARCTEYNTPAIRDWARRRFAPRSAVAQQTG